MRNAVNCIVWMVSGIILSFGIVVQILPNLRINDTIYFVPMLLLFVNMIYQLKTTKKEEDKKIIRSRNLIFIFIIYLFMLFSLLFFSRTEITNIQLFSQEHFEIYSNYVPFKTIGDFFDRWANNTINTNIAITNLLGNLVAFAPFGFFIPVLFKDKIKNFWSFCAFMCFLVVAVEFIQFVTLIGTADIDDLILNVFGAAIVYGVMHDRLVKRFVDWILGECF